MINPNKFTCSLRFPHEPVIFKGAMPDINDNFINIFCAAYISDGFKSSLNGFSDLKRDILKNTS